MYKFKQRLSLNAIERILPYLIVFPFGFILYKFSYFSIKESIVQDSKNGKIKETFMNSWIREICLNKVIMNNVKIRSLANQVLIKTVKSKRFVASASNLMSKIVKHQNFSSSITQILFTSVKTVEFARPFRENKIDFAFTSAFEMLLESEKEVYGTISLKDRIDLLIN